MIKKGNIKEYEWIKNGIKPLLRVDDTRWKGNTVGNLLPNVFEKYIKILHPMYKDKFFTDKSILWSETVDDEVVCGDRILWKELAREYDVQYKPEINIHAFFKAKNRGWPRYLISADEGTLDKDHVSEIVDILKQINCGRYFYYYDFLKTSDWLAGDKLYEGDLEGIFELTKLEDIRDYFEGDWKFSPSYWWLENREVCICTDYDLHFTIVGCNKEIMNSFMERSLLECIEVFYDTRIDYKAME
ncbi:hypothetical protein R9X47_28665 [Wukongibacter baidiensis]|uniref:hypothetical protein n=1 Tax=Wukongibacter baidiensis TaxID=1723361 RepID=UPI003D7F6857